MKLHLDLQLPKSSECMDHSQALLLIGSCFSEHIGHALKDLQFDVQSNPFGIVFNPLSISQSLQRILSGRLFTEKDLLHHNSLWHGIEAHGSFSGPDQQVVLAQLNGQLSAWHQHIQKADWLMITLGSAFVYRHLESDRHVANCHKIPQSQFSKELLTAEQITNALSGALSALAAVNPGCRVLLTVSPVKHLRDGVTENSFSKAILIQSVHELVKRHASCACFPAYELVTDDLRDYRFFEPDMAHPNQLAIDYVWQKFAGAYFSDATAALNQRLEELLKAVRHRPLHAGSEDFKAFKKSYALKCRALQKEFPFLRLDKETAYFES